MKELFSDKTVAFVSGANILTGKGLGEEIDSYDVVYRTNFFPGYNADDFGSRCDVLAVCKDFFHHIEKNEVPNIIHYDPLDIDGERNLFRVDDLSRNLITLWCDSVCGVNIITPTAGLIAFFLAHVHGAKSINMYGITGFQNKQGVVVNHSEYQHYSDEGLEIAGTRERLALVDMNNYDCHNYSAHNVVWRYLLKENKVTFDQYSKEYFL